MKYFDYDRAVIDVLEKEFGHSDLHVGLAQRITKALKVTKLVSQIEQLEKQLRLAVDTLEDNFNEDG